MASFIWRRVTVVRHFGLHDQWIMIMNFFTVYNELSRACCKSTNPAPNEIIAASPRKPFTLTRVALAQRQLGRLARLGQNLLLFVRLLTMF